MRMTPMDIEQQEFGKSFRGYNEEEVDDFLDKIVKEYEEIIKENIKLKEEIERMKDRLGEFSEIEETLRSALLNAQKSAEEMKGRVESESKAVVEKAEREAEIIKQKAYQKDDEVKNEINNLRRYKFIFKERFRSMLNLYLKMLENEKFEEKENYANNEDDIIDKKINDEEIEEESIAEKTQKMDSD